MRAGLARVFRRPRNTAAAVAAISIVAVGAFAATRHSVAPDLPTALVVKGPFVDTLEIRGEIRPLKSIVLSSPMQSGELQILKLAKSGTMVKPGDVVVQFDPSTLQRTIQEKQSELKQADAEIEQAQALTRIAKEQNATSAMKTGYDIDRAKLEVSKGDTVSRLDNEQAKLAVIDAQQRERELQVKIKSDQTAAEADVSAKRRKRVGPMTNSVVSPTQQRTPQPSRRLT
jgi:multidrug efflux pump subunit AcrA (membrane-fusion protein)